MERFYFSFKHIFYAIILAFFIHGCKNDNEKNTDYNYEKEGALFNGADSIGNSKNYKNKCGLKTTEFYKIKKLVDGDTFWLDDGCDGVKIRLIGIDAPESKNMFGTIKEEPFGKVANAYIEQLLKGKNVRVEFDIDTLDQYKRTLAYCFTDDGTFLNLKMVEAGMAQIMTIPPNVKYQELFYNAQVKARESKKGLWSKNIE